MLVNQDVTFFKSLFTFENCNGCCYFIILLMFIVLNNDCITIPFKHHISYGIWNIYHICVYIFLFCFCLLVLDFVMFHPEFFYITIASLIDNGVQAPLFLQEPISVLLFSNESGSQISCSAHGNPTPSVSWILKDGSPITSVLGLRYTI